MDNAMLIWVAAVFLAVVVSVVFRMKKKALPVGLRSVIHSAIPPGTPAAPCSIRRLDPNNKG